MNAPDPTAGTDAGSETTGMSRRGRGLVILATVVVVTAVAVFAYWFLHGRWYQSTDNAYVGGTIVQVTAEIPGTVRVIHPRETDAVAAGQALIEFDAADARIALDAAYADLGNTVRQVSAAFAQAGRARAQLAAREVELARARRDLERRGPISGGGAVSQEELAHARDAVQALEAAVRGAREELRVALAQTEGTTVEQHPQVQRAATRVRDAALVLERTAVASPVNGVVAKKGVQVGQRVAPGTPLMAVVPLDDVWVDANFKEVQLSRVRIGQPVELHADLYGKDVTFHGRVRGLSPGTGAAFALLPPQNASGNWIKIVQRVPVRIALDPAEVSEHPLRVGLSMHAEVDLHDQSGPVLAKPTQEQAASMPSLPEHDPAVEAAIEKIIAQNAGRAATG
jgi:membrane fusion protein (multidrug efflux system)